MSTYKSTGRITAGLLILANVLIPVSILIFATGFFPYKPVLPGLAKFEDYQDDTWKQTAADSAGDSNEIEVKGPSGKFDMVVFMVVDALRSDFVFMEGMGFEYTHQLIRQGSAMPFTAHATSPTITMPRIKAITTGGIPSFLDVILNFDEADTSSSLASQDTWLAQMRAREGDGKLLLYGDDTWLKLFPGMFDRYDGTSSFFVSDFTEVDNNVTRHIAGELQNNDWNTMVLHYLGLDHIGHKTGPRSPHMLPKQREMDAIVREIYEAIETQEHLKNTLLVLCGDHGMNDAGNHGASSPGETSPALVFISPKFKSIAPPATEPSIPACKRCGVGGEGRLCPMRYREDFQYYDTVEQSDLVPTLAALLGVPVPKNNLGAFIGAFLPLWEWKEERTQILMRNALQIRGIVEAGFPGLGEGFEVRNGECDEDGERLGDVERLACHWHAWVAKGRVAGEGDEVYEEWVGDVSRWLLDAQTLMTSMASNYNMTRLYQGIGLVVVAIISSGTAFHISRRISEPQSSTIPFVLTTAAYGTMMFASSYVEEEHHFWYSASTLYVAYLGSKSIAATSPSSPRCKKYFECGKLAGALLAMRVLRGWNQTGQKWAGEPDLVKRFVLPYPAVLWALVFGTYATVWWNLTSNMAIMLKSKILACMWTIVVVPVAIVFKVSFTGEDAPELLGGEGTAVKKGLDLILNVGRGHDGKVGLGLVQKAQLTFVAVGFLAFFAMHGVLSEVVPRRRVWGLRAAMDLWDLVFLMQTRTGNLPLLVLARGLGTYLSSLGLGAGWAGATKGLGRLEWTLAMGIMMQYASFFAMGGSNAISSVDLSSAYNGVARYSIVSVGILTYLGNWAGSVWWSLRCVMGLLERRWVGEYVVETEWLREMEREVLDAEKKAKAQAEEEAEEQGEMEGECAEQKKSKPAVPRKAPPADLTADVEPLLFTTHAAQLTVFTACSLAAVMMACTVLRTHLFIWTVFSPKYLYSMVWCLGQHLVVNLGLGGGLWWVGSA
ncbi:hypothetical protein MKZ38_008454 [Zalerion maritima]|uniref:GPI ethanolamine phosphate transferase 2 n=1 Tax=Zalerion maritima TaxID=339359 RepID=A0AAD5WV45_9PEZI|nr:hypothetical protein MKZ38_008454 [Zalerion maritima]